MTKLDSIYEALRTRDVKRMMKGETLIPADKELIALIRFANNGHVIAHTAIPHHLSETSVKEVVRIFLASVSVSEALLGKPKDEAQRIPDHDGLQKSGSESKATQILLGKSTKFIAVPSPSDPHSWFGMLVSRLVLNNTKIIDAILPALFNAANRLVLGSTQTEEKLLVLWNRMWELSKSKFWSDEKPVVHIKRALIGLAEATVYSQPQRKDESRQSASYRHNELATALHQFRESISTFSGDSNCACCVTSASMHFVFCDGMEAELIEVILWYYAQILRVSSEASRHSVFENVEGTTTFRLWHQWKGWVLCTQFRSQKTGLERQCNSLTSSAREVLRLFSGHATL